MKTIYFDCFAGAAGDMLLGALIDLGLPLGQLQGRLAALRVESYILSTERVLKQGVSAVQFRVREEKAGHEPHNHTHSPYEHGHEHAHSHENPPDHAHPHGHDHPHSAPPHRHGRSLADIEWILGEADLPGRARERALRAFRRLGEVEAGIHGVPVESIHFHEVGALDSIVDITGYFLALDMLGIERVLASPLPLGRGFVECAHGRMPVPAPATAKLVEGLPVVDNGIEGEALTPTGALLLAESAEGFGPMPPMRVRAVGYGAGERQIPPVPNVVRAFLGETDPAPHGDGTPDVVCVIETNLDDMRPEVFPHVIEGAIARGALDAFALPALGKKGRPAYLLTVLCPLERRGELTRFLFRETTTLGVRYGTCERVTAERDWLEVDVPWGRARVKRARYGGETVNVAPEFEDCRRLAEEAGVPLKEVLDAAMAAGRLILGEKR